MDEVSVEMQGGKTVPRREAVGMAAAMLRAVAKRLRDENDGNVDLAERLEKIVDPGLKSIFEDLNFRLMPAGDKALPN